MDAKEKSLNLQVARHVLGWQGSDPAELPRFSTDIAAAWTLADEICGQGYRLQLDGNRLWQARFYKSAAHTLSTKAFAATGRTPAEAICLAALAARGIQPEN